MGNIAGRSAGQERPLILLGLGGVGRALLSQILEQRSLHGERYGLRMRFLAVCDSSGAVEEPEGGFTEALLAGILQHKEAGNALASHRLGRSYRSPEAVVEELGRPGTVVVDCTASDGTAGALLLALERGYQVVLANKKPLTVVQDVYDGISRSRRAKRAGRRRWARVLPVIATLNRLVSSGDAIERIAGSFSGTLGYVMTGLEAGRAYSETVAEAYRLGYTEPDPRDDLGGVDVARKALILARGIGWRIEMEQVEVKRPVSGADGRAERGRFSGGAAFSGRRVQRAGCGRGVAEGKVLRYAATLSEGAYSVGLTAVAMDSPLGRLTGTDNLVEFYSRWYNPNPLVIQGRGAGVEATAAGVLSDIVELELQ